MPCVVARLTVEKFPCTKPLHERFQQCGQISMGSHNLLIQSECHKGGSCAYESSGSLECAAGHMLLEPRSYLHVTGSKEPDGHRWGRDWSREGLSAHHRGQRGRGSLES